MPTERSIKKIIAGEEASDGAGVRLTRVFGHHDTADFDPFLMLDAFDSTNPDDYIRGFPWHPHRGIETITYLISGDIEHQDSLGNHGSIRNGDCQWMTAGSGIIHQEMPQATEQIFGAQLWLNLPRKDKWVDPKYHDISQVTIPIIENGYARVRVISGIYDTTQGAFQGSYIPAISLDVEIFPGKTWSVATDLGNTVFIYIVSGSGHSGGDARTIDTRHAVLFEDGERISIEAGENGMRFLFLSAPPIHEPIAWGGPIVMNTQEELDQAFRDLKEGTFIKK